MALPAFVSAEENAQGLAPALDVQGLAAALSVGEDIVTASPASAPGQALSQAPHSSTLTGVSQPAKVIGMLQVWFQIAAVERVSQ